MRIVYRSQGERFQLVGRAGRYDVWTSRTGSGSYPEIGSYQADLSPDTALRLEQCAREADAFRLPAVVGAPWPGAGTRVLTVAERDDDPVGHEVTLHVLSGLPEPLRLFEVAIWEAALGLRDHPLAVVSADTHAPPRLAPGAPLSAAVHLRARGAALACTWSDSATLLVVQGSRTLVREPVRLLGGVTERATPAPGFAGSYQVSLVLAGSVCFAAPGPENAEAALTAAPALLTVG